MLTMMYAPTSSSYFLVKTSNINAPPSQWNYTCTHAPLLIVANSMNFSFTPAHYADGETVRQFYNFPIWLC
jgi:hypothetical protein